MLLNGELARLDSRRSGAYSRAKITAPPSCSGVVMNGAHLFRTAARFPPRYAACLAIAYLHGLRCLLYSPSSGQRQSAPTAHAIGTEVAECTLRDGGYAVMM